MKVKLTLNIDAGRIKKIKSYTKDKGICVSKFLEQQIDLIAITKPQKKLDVSLLLGAFGKAPKDFDWKKEKTDRLIKKYIK